MDKLYVKIKPDTDWYEVVNIDFETNIVMVKIGHLGNTGTFHTRLISEYKVPHRKIKRSLFSKILAL